MAKNQRLNRLSASEDPPFDAIDRRLLSELQAEARVRLAELGRRVGLSAPAVAERVQRLEDTGVISGYHAEIDPRAVGFPISAVIRIRPAARQLPRIVEIAR